MHIIHNLVRQLPQVFIKPQIVWALYTDDVLTISPFGHLKGADVFRQFLYSVQSAFPKPEVTVHEAWASPDEHRAIIRTHIQWHNTGAGLGLRATGKSGDLALVHVLTLNDNKINQQVIGFSTFSLPQLLMLDGDVGVAEVPDPSPVIVSAAPGEPGTDPGDRTLAQKFTRAFGARDLETLEKMYHPDVELFTPLGWPVRGLQAVSSFVNEFHSANPGMRVALHDEFDNGDERICWRIRLHFHNTQPFYGNPPTNDQGEMMETHVILLKDSLIVRQIVGDCGFQLPKGELVDWKMPFPTSTPDPDPVIQEKGDDQ